MAPQTCSARFILAFAGLLLLVPVAAVRHTNIDAADGAVEPALATSGTDARGPKYIEGVPVYNYHLAFQPDRSSSFLEAVKGDTNREAEHWLVFLKDGVTDSQIVKLCKETAKCTASATGLAFIEFLGTEQDLTNLLTNVREEVAFVEPDMPVAVIPEKPVDHSLQVGIKSTTSWGLDRINAAERVATGAGVHVFVLDTGVRTTHAEFEGRAIPTLEVSGMGRIQECRGSTSCAVDRQGHGTHCAGTVAGRRYGVAPGATIHAVKVLGDDGQGASSWTLLALDWVATRGQRPAVASMSLGSKGNSYADRQGLDKAVQAGVTVVVAAGNENDDACQYQPAFVPAAITVGATDPDDTRADYSNYGRCVDVFAPGTDIKSLGHLGDAETKTMSGTSMACPHVAGAAALILSANPAWTPDQVEKQILAGTQKNVIKTHTGKSLNGAPNMLLDVGGGTGEPSRPIPRPAPVPAPPSWKTPTPPRHLPAPAPVPDYSGGGCPNFAARRTTDLDGNCVCPHGLRCRRTTGHMGLQYCSYYRPAAGAGHEGLFLPKCYDCGCYK